MIDIDTLCGGHDEGAEGQKQCKTSFHVCKGIRVGCLLSWNECRGALPPDGCQSLFFEVGVCGREMVVSEESAVGTQGRWMSRLQHKVPCAVDDSPFALGIASPKDEDDARALLCEPADDGIGEFFPSPALVASRHMCPDGKCGIEEQYTLLCPSAQAAIGGRWRPEVVLDFLEDVDE